MLEVKWKALTAHKHHYQVLVSILVMLEVKWKVRQNEVTSSYLHCFNPCYVGSKMESGHDLFDLEMKKKFQSLLCWK